MRGFFLFILLLINCTVSKGQIYKYIGLEDGLNNQKIYHIQKDRRGYMWFLTQEGVDRYDGKHIKHYTFSDDSMKLDSRIALSWLYMDRRDVLWVIGQKGRIFKYDLKSATKLFSVLLASKRPLITELADKLRLKYPLLPTISPCPTMRLGNTQYHTHKL